MYLDSELTVRDGNRSGIIRVVDRPNQDDVRQAALVRYGSCIVTDTDFPFLLEAAHIKPYRLGGIDVDNDENILLLRSDIHRMFDADPALVYFTRSENPGHVIVHLTGGAENILSYQVLDGKEIPLDPLTLERLMEFGPLPPV